MSTIIQSVILKTTEIHKLTFQETKKTSQQTHFLFYA
jgi:hypothetical protein